MNNLYNEASIKNRKKILEQASQTLKSEFIGLDKIIDEICVVISAWFIFPEVQKRPLVVNVWGLTGTGKTALVKRLVELLDFNSNFLHLDMGEFNGTEGSWIKYMLTDDLEHYHEKPCVFCLDEFQFAKTLDENQNEIKTDKLRVIWELLDSGRIWHNPKSSYHVVTNGLRLLELLERFERSGIMIQNGVVVSQVDDFCLLMERFYLMYYDQRGETKNVEYFTSRDFVDGVQALMEDYELTDKELIASIQKMNCLEIYELLFKALKKYTSPKQLDLTKGLIFILGNLDEAFTMSHHLNPDTTADYFSEQVSKITIADIKYALQSRFRNEQIARLGNNHVIYPALNVASYQTLIERQLERIALQVYEEFQLWMEFSDEMKHLIYQEGVFPSQGTRPVLTTVQNLVESYMGEVLATHFEKGGRFHSVFWSASDKQLVLKLEAFERCHELRFNPVLKVHQLRESDNDDVQAHIAVHESGHAIAAVMSLRILPSQVVSKTASATMNGFCKVNFPEKLLTRDLLKKDIVISLAGWVAERMIFGEDFTCSGVSGDLEYASRLANEAVKLYGMGTDPIRIAVESANSNDKFFHQPKHLDEARKLIDEAVVQAEELLMRNKLLLLKMAQYLTSHSSMDEALIIEMVQRYSMEEWAREGEFIKVEEYFNSKKVLEEQLSQFEQSTKELNVLLKV